jgi:hypothetical protein
MPKTIIGTRLASPSVQGYPDKVQIIESDGTVCWECTHFSTNPNPIRPNDLTPWNLAYAQLAAAEIPFTCEITNKHGKCIVLNNFGICKTTNKNYDSDTKYPGTYTAEDCLIHCGYRGGIHPWRGSEACQTLDPAYWAQFIANFELNEQGIYKLVDLSPIVA